MLQVESSDVSFLFLAADSSAAPLEKTASSAPASAPSSSASLMNHGNQWQPPAWHHHHARHVPPPSTAAAHLPATFALPLPHAGARAGEGAVENNQQQHHESQQPDDQRYGSANYANEFTGYASYQDAPRDHYYSAESQWSYAAENHAHQQHQHANNQQQQPHQHSAVYGKPATESTGLAIDPLPLRHLVVPPMATSGNNGGSMDEELYEAHMLQEALTTPHYTRAHLGGFHHPHQLPAHLHQNQHQPMAPSQYSSPFVSAVLDASASTHHHHHHSGSSSNSLVGLHVMRQPSSAVTTPSEHTAPSDSDVASGSDLKAASSSKRKRRGESAPRLCRVEGCNKGIRSRGLCKAHGGGRRCMTPGCTTSDQGGGHCVLHGGGRRCTVENCTKSAQWKGLCKMHGGARRCRYQNCTKNGQVKAGYCRAHHNLITKQQREQGILDA